MAIYKLSKTSIENLNGTTLVAQGIKERADLQRLLMNRIDIVADDVLVIAQEFGEWDESSRRIDLLAIDKQANLVVIELKRDNTGAHMELQALRYAAMVSNMTFSQATAFYQVFLNETAPDQDAEEKLLTFLGWDAPREDEFGRDVRIILVAADFSKELTTAVLWLNERDLDIRCVRLKPYILGDQLIVDAQQLVPLPEAEEYQIHVREKAIIRREAKREAGEPTGYWFMNTGNEPEKGRAWKDCMKYGFMIAGGGPRWINSIKKLKPGNKFFAYLSRHGYVGYGEVLAESVPYKDFVPPNQSKRLLELPLSAKVQDEKLNSLNDPEKCDWCAAVKWIYCVEGDKAVLKHRALMGTVAQIKRVELVNELLAHFGNNDANS